MSLQVELASNFQTINVALSQQLLEKCETLCQTYNLDAEDFTDQWLAYTASYLNGAAPSMESLNRMERTELQKQGKSIVKTPKNQHQFESPERTLTPRALSQTLTPKVPINSKPQTPSQQFISRADACSVQREFGKYPEPKHKERLVPVDVRIEYDNKETIKYMYEKMLMRQNILNSTTNNVINRILKHNKLELTQERVDNYSGEMVIGGRIYSNLENFSPKSLILEGTLEMNRGHTIDINLEKLEKFALFSGQVVVFKGNNMKGRFMVTDIYPDAPPPSSSEPGLRSGAGIDILIACGPFTLPENLLYEPLDDLLKHVQEYKPDLLILLGPFIPKNHPLLLQMPDRFEFFFEKLINRIMLKVDEKLTKVVIIPSDKDVHGQVIFPSEPTKLENYHSNILFAPNPCILDVEGVNIAASSADILHHISKNEFWRDLNRSDERIYHDGTRLVSHLFNQRSFYPLHPPDVDISVDYGVLDQKGTLGTLPHLLILPSNLNHFITNVNGCVVVNPKFLCKRNVAGTFARVHVSSGITPICERISCQILRV